MSSFERFSGACAVAAGVVGFVYAVSFVVLRDDVLTGLCLAAQGVLASAVFVGLFGRLRAAEPTFALWGLVLGSVGALGAAVHGGYDLANALHPPATVNLDLPSQIDPRGLAAFGLTGIALLVAAWLITSGGALSPRLGYVTYLAGALLVFLYLARLIVLDPTNPVLLVPVLVGGFVVNPLWYVWVGFALRADAAAAQPTTAPSPA